MLKKKTSFAEVKWNVPLSWPFFKAVEDFLNGFHGLIRVGKRRPNSVFVGIEDEIGGEAHQLTAINVSLYAPCTNALVIVTSSLLHFYHKQTHPFSNW